MSDTLQLANPDAKPDRGPKVSRRFPAYVGVFADQESRRTIDTLVQWVEHYYREDLEQRPSKHAYVRLLPEAVIAQVDRLRNSAVIREAILARFDEDCVITPMQHTDELYISHYNKDYGGDQGLFDKHYDGNLRFLPYASVVRALIYLQSDTTYKVVFRDSGVEKAFGTYEFGLLDFHRELHWVEGQYNPADRQRILLKCNYLIAPRDGGLLSRAVLGANTAVFYVVKAAMEYAKSPKTPAQRFVGLLCNLFRLLNNVHPLVPLGFIAAMLGVAGWGFYRLTM